MNKRDRLYWLLVTEHIDSSEDIARSITLEQGKFEIADDRFSDHLKVQRAIDHLISSASEHVLNRVIEILTTEGKK